MVARAFLEPDFGLVHVIVPWWPAVCNGVGAGVGTCWRNKKAMQTCNLRAFLELDFGLMFGLCHGGQGISGARFWPDVWGVCHGGPPDHIPSPHTPAQKWAECISGARFWPDACECAMVARAFLEPDFGLMPVSVPWWPEHFWS